MNTEKKSVDSSPRYYKGILIPTCSACMWGTGHIIDNHWHCTMYEKEITNKIADTGFPEFCKLPKESVITKSSLQAVCDLLNSALKLDSLAVYNLITLHVLANKNLADHPTIQVRKQIGNATTVGMLGLLNGLGDKEVIAAYYDGTTGELLEFEVVPIDSLDTEIKLDD